MNQSRSKYFKLSEDGETPIACSLYEWAYDFERASLRIVSRDHISPAHTGYLSTVFLGVDHGYSYDDEDEPVLWESLVFGGPDDGRMRRCSGTRTDALKMHNAVLDELRNR
jgi:hypothetical protein